MDFRGFFNKLKEQVGGSTDANPREDPPEMIPEAPAVPAGTQTPPPLRGNASGGSSPRGAFLPGMTSREQSGGANPRAIVQNEKDDSVYQMRSGHIAQIEAMFGEFGPQVCSYMLTQSLSDGGVKRTLAKLGLQSRGRDGADLALIENWILKSGVPEFCQKVGLKLHRNAPPPPLAPPPIKEEPKMTVRSITPGSPEPLASPDARSARPAGFNPRNAETRPGIYPRPAESRPAPSGPPAPGNPSPLQKVSITPIGLAGKDVQRVHNRPAPAEAPRPVTPEPPPPPAAMKSPLPVAPPAPFVVPAPPPPTPPSVPSSAANELMRSALEEDSQRNPGR
jgi:hypothetical protein